MPDESVVVQQARIEERLRIVIEDLQEATAARKEQYKNMEQIRMELMTMKSEVASLKDSFTKSAPALQEYLDTKNKIIGAGVFGRWIWLAAGGLLGFVASGKGVLSWFTKIGG